MALFNHRYSHEINHHALQFANCNCDMQTKQIEPISRQIDFGELPLEKSMRHV
jgi:hypothetical protein